MRRGELWTVAGGADYAGKPQPIVIVQEDSFDATASITSRNGICRLTPFVLQRSLKSLICQT